MVYFNFGSCTTISVHKYELDEALDELRLIFGERFVREHCDPNTSDVTCFVMVD